MNLVLSIMPPKIIPKPETLKREHNLTVQKQCCKDYILTTLPKCYDPPLKSSEVKEKMTRKCGYRKYYLSKQSGLYRGWWKNNLRHGFGTQINTPTNEVYEGGFIEDKRSNYGCLSKILQNGVRRLLYEGQFKEGIPDGQGELHTDTYHYKGHVLGGKASGSGLAWYEDGSFYFGSWFDGKRTGLGMLVYKNKNRFEGNWFEDKQQGYGQYCFFDKGQALEGIWVDGVCVTGTIMNIKYRQAALNPVKYAIPQVMLKDWTMYYSTWEKAAYAKVGRTVRMAKGLKREEDYEKILEPERHIEEQLINIRKVETEEFERQFKKEHLAGELNMKFPPANTTIQHCVILK